MNSELLKRITVEPGKCGGRPCIRGLRMRVTDVLQLLYTFGILIATIRVAQIVSRMRHNLEHSRADLAAGDYTNKGLYVRLRYKFDESLFGEMADPRQAKLCLNRLRLRWIA